MVTTSLHASIVKLCKFLIKLYKYLFLKTHTEYKLKQNTEYKLK